METEFPKEVIEALSGLLASDVLCTVCGEVKHAKEFRSWSQSGITDTAEDGTLKMREGSVKNTGVCRVCEPPTP